MKIKKIFFLFFLLSVTPLFCEEYKIKTGRGSFSSFSTPTKTTESGIKPANVYYQYGIPSEPYTFIATGYLRVGLSPQTDAGAFASAHGLTLIKQTQKGHYLFQNLSGVGDMELCAKLGELDEVEFATPRFHGKKRLQ